jgi:hypothetical protein
VPVRPIPILHNRGRERPCGFQERRDSGAAVPRIAVEANFEGELVAYRDQMAFGQLPRHEAARQPGQPMPFQSHELQRFGHGILVGVGDRGERAASLRLP